MVVKAVLIITTITITVTSTDALMQEDWTEPIFREGLMGPQTVHQSVFVFLWLWWPTIVGKTYRRCRRFVLFFFSWPCWFFASVHAKHALNTSRGEHQTVDTAYINGATEIINWNFYHIGWQNSSFQTSVSFHTVHYKFIEEHKLGDLSERRPWET